LKLIARFSLSISADILDIYTSDIFYMLQRVTEITTCFTPGGKWPHTREIWIGLQWLVEMWIFQHGRKLTNM